MISSYTFLSLQIKRIIKTTREFITEVGIELEQVILELIGSPVPLP